MEAQICSMTSETAYLLGRLAIAKQKIRLPFIPCPRQLGDQVIPEDIDQIAIKDQVLLPKLTASLGGTTRGRITRCNSGLECMKDILRPIWDSRPFFISNSSIPLSRGGSFHSYTSLCLFDPVKIAAFNYDIRINACNIQCIFISSRALPPYYFGNAILSSHYAHLFNISEQLTVNKFYHYIN